MAKILKIENRIVTIGMENGDIEEYDIGYFNYKPHVNDEVKIYQNENATIIAKTGRHSGKHRVNRLTYGLFGVLLGGIGMNEFYAGNTGRGIVSCIFCWTGIPFIVNLIKGIAALIKAADENGDIWI